MDTLTHTARHRHRHTETETHRHITQHKTPPAALDTQPCAQAISASAGPRSGPSGGGATGHGAAAEDAAECGGARGGCPVGPAGKRVSLESDASYFASYSRLAIHEEMLSDAVRTDGYRHAIESNGGLLQGKVVLDVGCGSGGEIWGDMGRYGETRRRPLHAHWESSAACHDELARES